jgi:rhamnose utilization protein RhaD (predicted bifunctional aldolase and dehydrogenase)
MKGAGAVDAKEVLTRLRGMTRELGRYAILSEGNTSALLGDGTFWVKASGTAMAEAEEGSFVRMGLAQVLGVVAGPRRTEGEMRRDLRAAQVGPVGPAQPSIETGMHAVCLSLEGISYVGHSHPSAVVSLLCSRRGRRALRRPLYPVEGALWRPPLLARFAPPGQPLAREVERAMGAYLRRHSSPPSFVLLEGHGLAALGNDPQAVLDTTAMVDKMARVLLGAYALGGPRRFD